MSRQQPIFLNVDLSPQPQRTVVTLPQQNKTPVKQATRLHSPLESQQFASRKTSQLMSRGELYSKRSVISNKSQNRPEEAPRTEDKPRTTDFQQFYQRSLTKQVKVPSISPKNLTPQKSSQTHAMKQQKVKIHIRIKPHPQTEKSIIKKLSSTHLSVTTFEESTRQFEFASIFDNASQEEVYQSAAKSIVSECAQGRSNGVLLVYGQTGSGKTHTMGLLEQSKGLTQLAVEDLFDQLEQQKKSGDVQSYSIEMSFVQVYMDKIYDLLNNNGQQLQIREQKDSHPYIQGAVSMQIEDADEGIQLVGLGIKNRIVAAQLMNLNSSRSHTLLIATIRRNQTITKLVFIDLAGSERNKKSLSKGLRLDEATSINESLSALGNVIVALGQPNATHIPYRESKLTRILQGYLSGDAQICLICTITKSQDHLNETVSTLQFAQRCKDVVLRPIKPIQDEDTLDNNDLSKQIIELKQQIAELQQHKCKQAPDNKDQKEFLKFIINIIVKLKSYTSQNIDRLQQQAKSNVNEQLLQNLQKQSIYQIHEIPFSQTLQHEVVQLDQQKIEMCLDGNKESIRELAKLFTSDVNYLIQSYRSLIDLRDQQLMEQVTAIYRQREIQSWAKGFNYLLQIIKQQYTQIIQLKPKHSDIVGDYYLDSIKGQLFQIIGDKGQLYKAESCIKDLINIQETSYQFKSPNISSNSDSLPEKYRSKIERLLKSYGVGKSINIQEVPPPIFHSATVNVSNLMQSRKYANQNPFNDISSLNGTEPNIQSLDESNIIQDDSQQGKLRFKEDELLARNKTASFKSQKK